MVNLLYEEDADLSVVENKTITVTNESKSERSEE